MAAMMWGGHTIVARASVGEVSPMLMMALRWILCLVILLFFYGRDIKKEWPGISQNISWLALMGGVFLAGFTIFFILAAQYTSCDQSGDHAKLHPRHCGFAWLSFLETEIQVYSDLWIVSLDGWRCLFDLQWISADADVSRI
jgi:hypothetical protein